LKVQAQQALSELQNLQKARLSISQGGVSAKCYKCRD
jgi:hypothetical protein